MRSADAQRLFWQQQIAQWPAGQSITVEAMTRLSGSLGIVPVKPIDWMVAACRGALFVAMCVERAPVGHVVVRNDLQALSRDAWALWQRLFACPSHVTDALFEQSWRGMTAQDAAMIGDFGTPPLFVRYYDAVQDIQWLATFLQDAAARFDAERQPPNWRRALDFDRRLQMAICLLPVFEAGFGRRATVNLAPKKPGSAAWANFYVGVTGIAGVRSADNLRKVLLEAKRRHRENRVFFADGVMPD